MGIDADRLVVVPLRDALAADPEVAGGKAAALAVAAAAGLPVLPGFVLVPAPRAPGRPAGEEPLRRAWRELATGQDSERPLVVRSSSRLEDTGTSAMAGRFASVLGVTGWEDFTAAVRTVLESERRAGPAAAGTMAVLVQPMLRAAVGGVLFGADPVAGREDRLLVSAVRGGPHRLVSGQVRGTHYELSRLGRVLSAEPDGRRGELPLGRRQLGRLARLARRARRVFGGPQDIEFGFGADGRLWLLQSRPVTAMAARAPRGARLLGPGPVAETFPGVLQPLEEDLWLAPMAHGLALALDLGGGAPRRVLRTVPAVRTVGGRAVADLRLLGAVPARHPVLHALNPLPGARRTHAAWRIGRLRAALPLLAVDLVADVDRELAALPPPGSVPTGQLVAALSWGRAVLSALHAQESLAGALLRPGGTTAAGEALAVLAAAHARGARVDAGLIARNPVLLALVPPSLAPPPGGTAAALPRRTGPTGTPRGVAALPVREGLRLRIRWVQEMQARVVRELAARHAGGDVARLAVLRWEELAAGAGGADPPPDAAARAPRPQSPPLPEAFRLADDGRVVPEPHGRRRPGAGQGAGGGYGTGTAWHGEGPRPGDAVLVVRALDPQLAAELPGLAGLVSETGSVLSHLAVLAREYRVPAAVGVADALERFPPGTRLGVDGATGQVAAEDEPRAERAP